jgi:hypothetical protein
MCYAENCEISSDGGDSGNKKYKGGYFGVYCEAWWSLCLATEWNLEAGGQFCVDVFSQRCFGFFNNDV